MREVVIVDSVRTGLAKSFRGKFNLTRPVRTLSTITTSRMGVPSLLLSVGRRGSGRIERG